MWIAVLQAALDAVIRANDDGNAPATLAVIGMGRLGGGELGYGSDADVMFVCEPVGGADDAAAVRWSASIAEQVRALLGTPASTRRLTSTSICDRRAATVRWCARWPPTAPTTSSGRSRGSCRRCCGRAQSPAIRIWAGVSC
ncbi:glutamate-ammonia ligase adenylyltransferase family protein [Mycobacterium xenopi 3993]|nr:glutamate-ammonia ligase adenylyltransferase family protein [Mycobacterium xenopi 3993]